MNEREPIHLRSKLTVAVGIDYPAAAEVLVSFPDQWELVHQLRRAGSSPVYIAGFPLSREEPRRDHFYGLPPEINLELVTYRLYKFFEPWPMPSVIVGWDETRGTGQGKKWGI
jgi:hypothetical protein